MRHASWPMRKWTAAVFAVGRHQLGRPAPGPHRWCRPARRHRRGAGGLVAALHPKIFPAHGAAAPRDGHCKRGEAVRARSECGRCMGDVARWLVLARFLARQRLRTMIRACAWCGALGKRSKIYWKSTPLCCQDTIKSPGLRPLARCPELARTESTSTIYGASTRSQPEVCCRRPAGRRRFA
jgi:hypothetical protein